MPRTLVFCTAYADDVSVWQDRYRRWLDAIQASTLGAGHILIVDDGSATLPGWADAHIVAIDNLGDAYSAPLAGPIMLAHFRTRLGRADVLNFPGWHRSFAFAALYAERHGFNRVIHIESDAYVVSHRAQTFLAAYQDGWAAFWNTQYDMPESAIQVAAGQGVRALAGFAREPYARMIGRPHERDMPFSTVEKHFAGNRFGEFTRTVPAETDFAAQIPSRRERGFYWFAGAERIPPGAPRRAIDLDLRVNGNGLSALRHGWSAPEQNHHWIDGTEATLILPAIAREGDGVLRLRVTPHVDGDRLTSQRLIVQVNGCVIRAFFVTLESLLGCDVPGHLLGWPDGDVLRLVTPDAVAPCAIGAGSDTRRLSISVEDLHFSR